MADLSDIHLEQGIAAFDRGDLAESIEHFRKAVAGRPDDPDLHRNLAVALDGNGDVQGAGAEYQEAVRLSPADEVLHYGLGTHFLKTRQWDRAVASFREAVRIQPGYLNALNATVTALAGKARSSGHADDYGAYLTATEQMLARFPEALLWRENRAWALWQLKRSAEAVAEMEGLVFLEPTSRRYSRLLFFQRRTGRWRDFLRTSRAMIRYEWQRGWRRMEWQESEAEKVGPT